MRKIASRKSLLIEQQMQPFSNSTMLSAAEAIRSLSMPISLSSLTMTAVHKPCWLVRMCLIRLVLPLPRKPVITVTGKRASEYSGGDLLMTQSAQSSDAGLLSCLLTTNDVQRRRCISCRPRTGSLLHQRHQQERAVAGDDVRDTKRPQPFNGVRNDPFHHAAEVQPAHDAVDWNVGKEIAGMEAYVDDARVRGGAEDGEAQIAHVCHQHALVHEQRIGFPRPARTRSRQMVDAAFLERCQPRYLAAVVKVAVEQEPGIGNIDHPRAALLEVGGARNVGDGYDHATLKPDGTFVEHSGIDVHGDVTAVFHDSLDGVRKRGHVIPVSMADRNAFDLAQANSEIGAVADEDRPFRPGIEQKGMPDVLGSGHELQPKPKISQNKRLAGNDLCPGQNDVGKLGYREQGFADIRVADIVGDHFRDERIDRLEGRRWTVGWGHSGGFQCEPRLYWALWCATTAGTACPLERTMKASTAFPRFESYRCISQPRPEERARARVSKDGHKRERASGHASRRRYAPPQSRTQY